MKNLNKIAVLGAALVASVPFASAAPIPVFGSVDTAGGATFNPPPFVFNATGSGSSGTFSLSGILAPGLLTPPTATGTLGGIVASTFTITDFDFNSAGVTPAGEQILSIADTGAFNAVTNPLGGDTLVFFATSYNNIMASSSSSEGAVNLFGYLTNSAFPGFQQPGVQLNFAANGLGNNYTEDLVTTTPEPNTLILLGTGLLGAAGMLLWKRRTALPQPAASIHATPLARSRHDPL